MAPGWSHGLIHCPFFFGIEWWVQSCCKGVLCLAFVRMVLLAVACIGTTEADAGLIAGQLAYIGFLLSVAALILLVFTRLMQRKITDEQYEWCKALRPYARLPLPSATMTKVDLATYVWAYQQMSKDEQSRHYPHAKE